MNKKWEFYEKDEEKIKRVQQEFKISKLLATVIVNKNLSTKEEIETFLNPTTSTNLNLFVFL